MSVTTAKRRTTAADVAKAVGVSRATVGYVMNETPGQTISEATRTRILEVAQELGYRPRAAAQALASGRTRLVLLVLPDWPLDHSARRYIEEASLVLDEAGYSLVTWTPHATGRTRPLWEQLDPDVVIGFAPFSDEEVQAMHAQGIHRIIPEPRVTPERPVGRGPALQIQHLHDLGHRRIAFANTSDRRLLTLAEERATVAADAARLLDVDLLPSVGVDSSETDAAALIADWMSQGVTGVVAYNDEVAAVIVRTAVEAGVPVPERLSVIGHDDSPLASLFLPQLSSVRLDNAGLGKMVAELALARIEERQPALDRTAPFETIVARASTARVAHTG